MDNNYKKPIKISSSWGDSDIEKLLKLKETLPDGPDIAEDEDENDSKIYLDEMFDLDDDNIELDSDIEEEVEDNEF